MFVDSALNRKMWEKNTNEQTEQKIYRRQAGEEDLKSKYTYTHTSKHTQIGKHKHS